MGSLVICDIVYGELSAQFASQPECDNFLEDSRIRVERISREALFAAAQAWRRHRRQGRRRDRILPDFLIGAHAHHQASQLVSRDAGFYRATFRA